MSLYERGAQCEWLGVRVFDMTRDQLIEFIGQLDYLLDQDKDATDGNASQD